MASMFKSSREEDEESDDDLMDTDSANFRQARKRKSFLKGGRSHQCTSPTSSPSKRPRKLVQSPIANFGPTCSSAPAKLCQTASPALDLLETKKKAQRNSLYHWVLWREALRGEKDRVQANPRRLSFSTN